MVNLRLLALATVLATTVGLSAAEDLAASIAKSLQLAETATSGELMLYCLPAKDSEQILEEVASMGGIEAFNKAFRDGGKLAALIACLKAAKSDRAQTYVEGERQKAFVPLDPPQGSTLGMIFELEGDHWRFGDRSQVDDQRLKELQASGHVK